jgi:hypothetical protein
VLMGAATAESNGSKQWNIDPQGAVSISYVKVSDSTNLRSVPLNPANSTIDSTNVNWVSASASNPALAASNAGTASGTGYIVGENILQREMLMPKPMDINLYSIYMMTPAGPVAAPAAALTPATVLTNTPASQAISEVIGGVVVLPKDRLLKEATVRVMLPLFIDPQLFSGVRVYSMMPEMSTLSGARSVAMMPGMTVPGSFNDAAIAQIPVPVPFVGASSLSMTAQIVRPEIFTQISVTIEMPIAASVKGAMMRVAASQIVSPDHFGGIKVKSLLPKYADLTNVFVNTKATPILRPDTFDRAYSRVITQS